MDEAEDPENKNSDSPILTAQENREEPKPVDNYQKLSSEQEMNAVSNLRHLSFGQIRKIIRRKRKWWYTEFGTRHLQSPNCGLDFTVMSYNILSQTLLENHPYLYTRCHPEYLSWNYRSQNLLREMYKRNADIMCLQEVEENHYHETFLPFLNRLGYVGMYKKKTGNANDGCAIFFKTKFFGLEGKYEVEYKHSCVEILDRNNVGLIVVLRPELSKLRHLKLICATTHLLFNPRRGDVKLAQLRLLLAAVEKLARKEVDTVDGSEYHPVILCGDMNSEPFYPLYNFVVRGRIEYDGVLSGNISGQREGINRGRVMSEGSSTLASLGISQNTCFESHLCTTNMETNAVQENLVGSPSGSTVQYSVGENLCQNGCFFQPMSFCSTYKHIDDKANREVTSWLSDTMCTVDYTFYTVKRTGYAWKAEYDEEEGKLRHIGCYGLLHESDVKSDFELPNAYLSSDHFCLISRFLLTDR